MRSGLSPRTSAAALAAGDEAFAQNAARNEPFVDDVHHPGYTPLQALPDGELAAVGRAQLKALGETQPRL